MPGPAVTVTVQVLTQGRLRHATFKLETGHKFSESVRAVAHKTNNQAKVGGSILEASIQREAAESLASQIDRTGA